MNRPIDAQKHPYKGEYQTLGVALMTPLRTENVFVTEGPVTHTFIDPPGFSTFLVDIRSQARPLVVEGASGTGKTTTIRKGIERAGIPSDQVAFLSARDPKDLIKIETLAKNGTTTHQVVVIDDFHRLNDEIRLQISDLLRLSADRPGAIGGKLIVAGINKAGEQLIQASEDLLKRMSIRRVSPADRDVAIRALSHGASLLNVTIENLEAIYDEAKGDYWTLQKLCQAACMAAGVLETSDHPRNLTADLKSLRNEILNQLSTQFSPLLKDFVRGSRFRKTNRTYLVLLELFAETGASTTSLNELSQRFPKQRIRLDAIKKLRLPKLIASRKTLPSKFYYDSESTIFSVEDPSLSYFIKHLDWREFGREIGFTEDDKDYPWDIGISFAGEQRELARALASSLESQDVAVFFDEFADLLGKNLENELETAYGNDSRFVVAIISEEYREKFWPTFERAVWQKRTTEAAIIPVFVDTLIIKEISTSICRIDFSSWRDLERGIITKEEWDQHFQILLERIQKVLSDR